MTINTLKLAAAAAAFTIASSVTQGQDGSQVSASNPSDSAIETMPTEYRSAQHCYDTHGYPHEELSGYFDSRGMPSELSAKEADYPCEKLFPTRDMTPILANR